MAALPFGKTVWRAPKPPPKGYPANPTSLGQAIRKGRMDLGLTQRQLAERFGVNVWNVRDWERGRSAPARGVFPAIRGIEPR
jgi:ribosome-binding protein aMBF1 (putative translation factor)